MIRRVRRRSVNWVLRNLALPLGDIVFQQWMMRRLRYLEAAQWWDPERLYAERDRLLRETVAVAYEEVPLYRELFDERGLTPSDVASAQDLVRLPIVTKGMLRAGFPARTSRKTGFRTYVTSTSGSTGSNFHVVEDAPTAGWYRASAVLSFQWAGWQIGERHMQFGITISRTLDRKVKDALLRCHYINQADLSDAALDANLAVLEDNHIEHLFGYPGSLYQLALRAIQQGWNRPLRSIVTWGDTLYPGYRAAIERAFGTRVHDTYGCSEGMQIAAQCGHEQNYHIHTLDVVVETTDEAGNLKDEGESGNILLTRLHAGAMPFLRYQVGDVGTLGPAELCACGRGFARMQSVEGRDTDIVITPSGNRLIVHFFTGVIEHFSEIESFQVLQSELESILVRVVPAAGYGPEVEQRLVRALSARGAESLRIVVEAVDEIPTPSGKRRFVISEYARTQSLLEHPIPASGGVSAARGTSGD